MKPQYLVWNFITHKFGCFIVVVYNFKESKKLHLKIYTLRNNMVLALHIYLFNGVISLLEFVFLRNFDRFVYENDTNFDCYTNWELKFTWSYYQINATNVVLRFIIINFLIEPAETTFDHPNHYNRQSNFKTCRPPPQKKPQTNKQTNKN